MSRLGFAVAISALGTAIVVPGARTAQTASLPDVAIAKTDAGTTVADGGGLIEIAARRTTVVTIEPRVGRPIEREPEFLRKAPSYRRAIEMDRDQRWAEAAGQYQQALIEIGAAVRFAPTPLLEQAAFKIDAERRRSRTLAQTEGAESGSEPTPGPTRGKPATAGGPAPMPALDRARLLRSKLMAVRSATGLVPAALVTETLVALGQALRQSNPRPDPTGSVPNVGAPSRPQPRGGDPEIRLLLCATRAVGGDRTGARLEQAHVSQSDRFDPTRALALAACQAALGYNDQALASLAVVVSRLGPSPRFLPGQSRELQSANDWDPFRDDPRFERLFR